MNRSIGAALFIYLFCQGLGDFSQCATHDELPHQAGAIDCYVALLKYSVPQLLVNMKVFFLFFKRILMWLIV